MLSSVKARIIFGFGIVMALLITATIANLALVSGIASDFDQFQSALNRKSQAIDIDLVMQKGAGKGQSMAPQSGKSDLRQVGRRIAGKGHRSDGRGGEERQD